VNEIDLDNKVVHLTELNPVVLDGINNITIFDENTKTLVILKF
jgi:hypothetical protein